MRHLRPDTDNPQDIVRQRELLAVIILWNRLERQAAAIRKRLEAGAGFERGALGAATWGHESLAWYAEHGGIGTARKVIFVGLEIGPADYLRGKYPDSSSEVWL